MSGSSENAEAVKDLLNSPIKRGLATGRKYLFAINGSKALRSAIKTVFGERAHVQRCRTHKIRNVTERLPKPVRQQIAPVMCTSVQAAGRRRDRSAEDTGGMVESRSSGCCGVAARRA